MRIDRHALRRILDGLPFEVGRWVVAGSAPMLVAGLIESIDDVDVVVDAVAWRQAVSLDRGEPREGLFGDHMVELEVTGAPVEVFDGWLGTDAATMIAEAEEYDGFPFSPLERVAASKRLLGRPKDLEHLRLIARPEADSR